MDTSLWISSGALQTFQQKIDNISNNVSNSTTPGFKRKETTFSEILANQLENQTGEAKEPGRLSPTGLRTGYGTRLGLTQMEFDQGKAIQTGKPFDLMIEGKGFFAIGHENSTVRLTRDGSFQLSPVPKDPNNPADTSNKYTLVNENGFSLLDEEGQIIKLEEGTSVQIRGNGDILLKDKDGQEKVSDQKIALVDVQNPHLLEAVGDNEFIFNNNVLVPGTATGDYIRIMTNGEKKISTGYLEGANVDLSKEMSDLIVTQRAFQLNSRSVAYSDQMMGITNSILK